MPEADRIQNVHIFNVYGHFSVENTINMYFLYTVILYNDATLIWCLPGRWNCPDDYRFDSDFPDEAGRSRNTGKIINGG